jgi:hypothetical protein
VVLDGRKINGGKEMKKKKPEKSKAEQEREEKEFFKKNRESLEKALVGYCKQYNLDDYSPPFSVEEGEEILKIARRREFEEIEMLFPGFSRYNEDMQINCKLCFKFHLDPKLVTDRPAIMEAISNKLKGSSNSVDVNSDLFKFRKG